MYKNFFFIKFKLKKFSLSAKNFYKMLAHSAKNAKTRIM